MLATLLAVPALAQNNQIFDRILIRSQNEVQFADQQAGADAFAKINSAIAALPPSGGTVDARGFGATTQPVATPLTIGGPNKPVVLIIDGNTQFLISLNGGVDAIQLWSKSSLICLNQTNATSATFTLTSSASVNTILSTFPRTPEGNLTYQQGCSFMGNSSARVASALVELYNPTDISAVRNELIWNFFGIGLKLSVNRGSGGAGPVNLENLSVNGFGNPGAVPVLIQANPGSAAIGGINFLGGSYTHPGAGGLPIIDLEGGSIAGVEGINFFGSQFESSNPDDIGILINDARDVLISGTLYTAAGGKPGADCVKIAQSKSSSLGVIINNLINLNSWTHSINDTVNGTMDKRSRVVGYTMGSADSVLQSWVGAYSSPGKIADITSAGLVLSRPQSFVEGPTPKGGASRDVCYGDSAAHALKCSYNNGLFFQIPQVIKATTARFAIPTIPGTCVQNTVAVAGAAPGMTVAVSPAGAAEAGAIWSAFISSSGNVTINDCAVTPSPSGTTAFNISIFP